MSAFEQSTLVDAPPHVYALVEGAYRKAVHGGGSQSLIISGESGAGKTESTKLALSYLVWRTRKQAGGGGGGGGGGRSQESLLTTSIIQVRVCVSCVSTAAAMPLSLSLSL